MAENQERRKAGVPATVTPEPTNLPDLPTREGLRVLWQIADFAVKAGMAGRNETVGGVTAKLVAALEEGIGPMKALTKLYHVPGSSGLGSLTEVKLAKFNKAGHRYKTVSNDGETCVIDLYLRGQTAQENRVERVELTREYCDQRGWTTDKYSKIKDNWEKDPIWMLWRRTFSFGYRMYCPECEYIRLDETVPRPVMTMDDMEFLGQMREEHPEQFEEFMRAQAGAPDNGNRDVVEGEYEEQEEPDEGEPAERRAPEWTKTEKVEHLHIHATQELKLTDEEYCNALALDSVDDLEHYPVSYRVATALLDDYYEAKEEAAAAEAEVEELDQGHPPKKETEAQPNGRLL